MDDQLNHETRVDTTFDLVVVIPTHNRVQLLRRTLASLGNCRLPENYDRTIVIENGGQFGVETVVAEADKRLRAEYRYCCSGNKSAALNSVLNTVQEPLLVFFDDDVRIDPQTLLEYSEAAQGSRSGFFFGGPCDVDQEISPPEWLLTYLPPSATGWHWSGESPDIDQPVLMGANWAAFAADLRAVGGFDERVGPGAISSAVGQESSIQRKLLSAGKRGRYVEAARVWHYVPADRCSPEWALQRAFRMGAAAAIRSPFKGPRLLGIPRWLWPQYAKKFLLAAAASARSSARRRFQRQYDLSYFRGFMHGYRADGSSGGSN